MNPETMTEKKARILFVDDDPMVLSSMVRLLRHSFEVQTASAVAEAVMVLRTQGPFAVVVSDLEMPTIDGIQFLSRLRLAYPDTVRIMLTGRGDLGAAMQAINEGHIFRFLTKPCPPAVLKTALSDGVRQYQLITAERELLEKTVTEAIALLNEILGVANSAASDHAYRVRRLMTGMATALNVPDPWIWQAAASLSQLGCIVLAPEILDKVFHRVPLTQEESALYQKHPQVGANLIRTVSRLERVAEVVARQNEEAEHSDPAHLAARALKAALDFDLMRLQFRNETPARLFAKMRERTGCYDPIILDLLEQVATAHLQGALKSIPLAELTTDMVFLQDLVTTTGTLLVREGEVVTRPMMERLALFQETVGIRQPFHVFVPTT
ncbi:MAG: response regulator [Magnetococcales bacterium]|nr:response regulator [Magnetococcales bacterium]